jgi:predicted RNase H-like HicB family nuclease
MKSYVFKVELEQDDDGRWSAVIPALPGCASAGQTAQEALENVEEAAQAYVEVLIEDGKPIPIHDGVSVVEGSAVLIAS